MILEIPIDNPPPVINTIKIPEYARHWCDLWGNLKLEPLKVIEDHHASNFLKVFIYCTGERYYFGYQLKIKKLIFQKQANIDDCFFETEEKAYNAARAELSSLADDKKIKKEFILFDKICYNQPELF